MLEKIKQIKINRLKPEEIFLLKILSEVKSYTCDQFKEYVYYKLNEDYILFRYTKNTKEFIVDEIKIWKILQSKYHLNRTQIHLLIKENVKNYLNLKNVNNIGSGITIGHLALNNLKLIKI